MNSNAKSYILGLGSGIIIITLAFYMFFGLVKQPEQSTNPVELTDEEIVQRAKKMGLVYISELPQKSETISDDEIIERATKLGMTFNAEEIQEIEENQGIENEQTALEVIEETGEIGEELIEISIERGANASQVAKMLFDKNIIENPESFHKILVEKGVTRSIPYGVFLIPKGCGDEEALSIILG